MIKKLMPTVFTMLALLVAIIIMYMGILYLPSGAFALKLILTVCLALFAILGIFMIIDGFGQIGWVDDLEHSIFGNNVYKWACIAGGLLLTILSVAAIYLGYKL